MPKEGKLVCNSCGLECSENISLGQKSQAKKRILEDARADVNPIVDAKCGKCGNNKAYYAIKQTRSSDEAPTKFFRCTNCGFTWRDYN